MECYFGSYQLPEDKQVDMTSVVTFHIPDLGIRFKAPFAGANSNHSDFASLLALLEFIDGNQKYFSNHTYEVFGNSREVVEQVNLRQNVPAGFNGLLERAMDYRDKYRFSINWVADRDNPAYEDLEF
jgi:hypothetical protein